MMFNFEYFYFIRHGRTDANDLSLMAGGTNDIPINATGYAQALNAALILKNHCQDIQSICASQMTRAQQTAHIILSQLDRPLTLSPDLIEWKFGEWEGRTWDEISPLFLDERSEPELGEGRLEFKNRVIRGLQSALQLPHPVLIVAHGGVWYMIQKIFNLPLQKTDNCQIFKIYKEHNGKYNYYEVKL
jgi:probable phosphoglycerate mutase